MLFGVDMKGEEREAKFLVTGKAALWKVAWVSNRFTLLAGERLQVKLRYIVAK